MQIALSIREMATRFSGMSYLAQHHTGTHKLRKSDKMKKKIAVDRCKRGQVNIGKKPNIPFTRTETDVFKIAVLRPLRRDQHVMGARIAMAQLLREEINQMVGKGVHRFFSDGYAHAFERDSAPRHVPDLAPRGRAARTSGNLPTARSAQVISVVRSASRTRPRVRCGREAGYLL